jgi:hypothetical protein
VRYYAEVNQVELVMLTSKFMFGYGLLGPDIHMARGLVCVELPTGRSVYVRASLSSGIWFVMLSFECTCHCIYCMYFSFVDWFSCVFGRLPGSVHACTGIVSTQTV